MRGRLAVVSSRPLPGEFCSSVIRDVVGWSLSVSFRRLTQPVEFGSSILGPTASVRALVSGARGLIIGARGLAGSARRGSSGSGRAHTGVARHRRVDAHREARFPGAEIAPRREVARLTAGSGQSEF